MITACKLVCIAVLALCGLVLSSCAEKTMIPQPFEVKIPVASSCEPEMIPEPGWNVPHLAENADDSAKLNALMDDLVLSQGYIEMLQAELLACG